MGSIRRFDLSRIAHEYKLPVFFETGTFRGDGVAFALESSFQKIFSIEIVPEIGSQARNRFAQNDRVEILTNDSISALKEKLPTLDRNCLFWLDAHFPGADAGLTRYDDGDDENLRLPLAKELEAIRDYHSRFKKDVFILDDLRIYEDGPFQNGAVPVDALPASKRNIDFVFQHFQRSHLIFRSYLDEGYLLLFPKFRYRLSHFSLKRIFGRPGAEDFYLLE